MAIVQALWIGERLSALERLSLTSFLAHGHECHLYTYGPVADVPAGVTVRDGNEIFPASKIFRYRDCGSLSGFANQFRYQLLLERGGWWMDLDMVCLRPLPAEFSCVIASEANPQGGVNPTNSALFAEPGSPLMAYVSEIANAKDPEKLKWCETGPDLITKAVQELSAQSFVLPAIAFCPIPYSNWIDTFLPGRAPEFTEATYTVHFWHEMWRRTKLDKNEDYGPRSLYEILKRRYGIT